VGENGVHYLVVTNKSGSAVPVGLEVNGSLLESTVTVSYVSNSDPTAQNTATDQNNVQIVNNTSPNPITVGPYSVTRIQW
jgi:alpha-L-arabinofuranosidase